MADEKSLKEFVDKLDGIINKYGGNKNADVLKEIKELKQVLTTRSRVEVTNLRDMPQPIVSLPQRMKIVRPDWLEEMITRIVKQLLPKEEVKEESKEEYSDDELGFIVDKFSAKKTYIGYAKPGASEKDPVWRIKRLREDDQKNTVCEWADGNADFDNIWSRRDMLKYV